MLISKIFYLPLFSQENRENYTTELWHILATALERSIAKQEKHSISPNERKSFWANLEYCIYISNIRNSAKL